MASKINRFVKKLARTQTHETLFNQYNELKKSVDDRTAPGIRQQNLRLYLNSHLKLKSKILWTYLAPTYLEARRSGVPLLNVSLFKEAQEVLKTTRRFQKATKSREKPYNTVISSSLWDAALDLEMNPIIWPIMPFYPHKTGGLKSKRAPTKEEIRKHKWVIKKIIDIYKPKKILAVGKDAKKALDLLDIKSIYIKHPRRGKKAFRRKAARYK